MAEDFGYELVKAKKVDREYNAEPPTPGSSEWLEWMWNHAVRDDWHYHIVGSDIRILIEMARRNAVKVTGPYVKLPTDIIK